MEYDVACLRPEADFLDIGVVPPRDLSIAYLSPDDPALASTLAEVRALVIPAVGPKLDRALFENSDIRLVQVTGAGVDRLDEQALRELGIAVANVAGGSNDAVAEYAVGSALTLLRRLCWADAEIRAGNYSEIRSRMVADALTGLTGLVVGVVGLGTIGRVVAKHIASLFELRTTEGSRTRINNRIRPTEVVVPRADGNVAKHGSTIAKACCSRSEDVVE